MRGSHPTKQTSGVFLLRFFQAAVLLHCVAGVIFAARWIGFFNKPFLRPPSGAPTPETVAWNQSGASRPADHSSPVDQPSLAGQSPGAPRPQDPAKNPDLQRSGKLPSSSSQQTPVTSGDVRPERHDMPPPGSQPGEGKPAASSGGVRADSSSAPRADSLSQMETSSPEAAPTLHQWEKQSDEKGEFWCCVRCGMRVRFGPEASGQIQERTLASLNKSRPCQGQLPAPSPAEMVAAKSSTLEISPEPQAPAAPESSPAENAENVASQGTKPLASADSAASAPQLSEEVLSKLDRHLEQSLRSAWGSLQSHDTEKARAQLKLAKQVARTPEEAEAVSALEELADHLDEFWRVMGGIIASLESTEVIPVAQTEVIVIESSATEITLKAEGQIRTFALRQIPSSLVKTLALKRFGTDPASKAIVGIYFAMEPRGEPERARQLLEEAKQGGVDLSSVEVILKHFNPRLR